VDVAHGDNLLRGLAALPVFGVAIRKSHFASARVNAIDAGLAAAVEGALDGRAIGELEAIGFECDRKAFVIDEFDLDPRSFGRRNDCLVWLLGGRTCRAR
jgi:hypothetical protein